MLGRLEEMVTEAVQQFHTGKASGTKKQGILQKVKVQKNQAINIKCKFLEFSVSNIMSKTSKTLKTFF